MALGCLSRQWDSYPLDLELMHVIMTLYMTLYNIAGTSADDSSNDWKKCQAVARIIASCPSGASTVEEYYSLICPQVN